MSASVLFTCLLSFQQLTVGPAPASVGEELVLRATIAKDGEPVAAGVPPVQTAAEGVAVTLALPDGSTRDVGTTDASGALRFRPEVAGQHAFVATIDGVRCLASLAVAPARNRWLLGIVCVPLGVALLWLQVRRLAAGRAASARVADAQAAGGD